MRVKFSGLVVVRAGGCSLVVRALARVLISIFSVSPLSCWPGCVLVSDLPLCCNWKSSVPF